MIKGRKIRGIIVAIALIICTAVSVAADSSKGWNIEHKSLEANFMVMYRFQGEMDYLKVY